LLPPRPIKRLIQPYAHTQFAHLRTVRGLAVIRTVWLAILCLIGLGAMVALRAGTPTPPPSVRASPAQTTVGQIFSQDTLTKADRLDIAYVPDPIAPKPVMPATKVPDETPSRLSRPTATTKIVSRHRHDPHARKPAAVPVARRNKEKEPKKDNNVDRSKPMVDLRPCRRPEGFAGLLRALNLTPGCDT
jgi:hypothetical protein